MFECARVAECETTERREKNKIFIIDTKDMKAYCIGYCGMFDAPIKPCVDCEHRMDDRDVREDDRFIEINVGNARPIKKWH